MGERQQLIRAAFAACNAGDIELLQRLFDADARWIGIPQGRGVGDTPCCRDRSEIVSLLGQHHANGRRFGLGEMIEQDDRIAVETTITDPRWSEPVSMFKVFTFRSGDDVAVQLNDCIDESYALQVLAV
jgi:ketosteroid isomerase-like protein